MKRIILTALVLPMMILPLACDESLDINVNPLRASSADPNAILPYVLVQFSNRNTTELGTRICDVYQHTAVTFNSPRGGSTTSFLTGNTWGMLYVQVLGNLSLVEKDAREAGPTSNNITAIALIMKALAFYEATVIWEEVPFTEALNADEFTQPNFDSQETVLKGIIPFLDEAVTLIDAMPTTGNFNLTGDLVYGGNMDNWKKFANSLNLRVNMLIRNKDTSVDTKITSLLSGDLIESNGDAALLRYPGTPGNDNAWKQIVTAFGSGSNEDSNFFGPSPIVRSLLDGDPRLELYLTDGSQGGFLAQPIGQFPDLTVARYSDNLIRGDLPDIWYLPGEISFYRAELAAKAGDYATADTEYRKGVTQTIQFWGQDIPGAQMTLSTGEINAFVSSLPTLDASNALTEIGNQQYLETFWRPVEAWTHVRRTKVPEIKASPGSSISTMLKRFTYPPDEIGSNSNTPANKATDVPQWFEN